VDESGLVATTAGGGQGETDGALLAALVAALKQAAADLSLGDMGELLVEAGDGSIMAGALAGGRAAVVVTNAGANLGLVRVELRRLRRTS